MPNETQSEIYNKTQLINVLHKNEVYIERNLLINITEYEDVLKIKVRDANEYNFNYNTTINSISFEKMKHEQCLEISFREFKPQILELLKSTELCQMLLRFEVYDFKARMVFYEKAKLKSLIFLIVDLNVTEQSEIIKEMSFNIQHLKEHNSALVSEMYSLKKHINDKEEDMRIVNLKHFDLQKEYIKHLQNIDGIVNKNLQNFYLIFTNKITKLNDDIFKLMKHVEIFKEKDNLRRSSSLQINQTCRDIKLDLKIAQETIVNLEENNKKANEAKAVIEQKLHEVKLELVKKNDIIHVLEEKISELKTDMQNATLIIAEKSKTNDELARDLVQANQMIVNFNNRIDKMANEKDSLMQQLKLKDDIINEQKGTISRVREEYDDYKSQVKIEEMLALKEELLNTKKDMENMEKQNRELAKLNTVLTRKVAGTNIWTAQSQSR